MMLAFIVSLLVPLVTATHGWGHSAVVARYEIVAGGKHDSTYWNSQWGPMFAAAAETFGITKGTP